ncbi:MAG: hypothetical protein IPJ13_21130 [Saprospiraceae bacterium]|nr:hypothetical protein [Saprospiraceae bacterium]
MSHMLLMRHKYIDMEYNKLEDHIAYLVRYDEVEIHLKPSSRSAPEKESKICARCGSQVCWLLTDRWRHL